MKKLSILIVALLLTVSFSINSMTCLAQGGSVTVNGASAKAGEEVTVEIVASGIKQINSGSIEIKSLPEGVSAENGEWTVAAELAHFDKSVGRGVFALGEKADLDGTVFKLTLKLGDNAKSGAIVCELRFKDGSNGNADVAGIENIAGKLVVKGDGSSGEPAGDTDVGEPSDDTADGSDGSTDDVQEPHGDDKSDGTSDGTSDLDDLMPKEERVSPIEIVLLSVAGAALIAAVVILLTKNKKDPN